MLDRFQGKKPSAFLISLKWYFLTNLIVENSTFLQYTVTELINAPEPGLARGFEMDDRWFRFGDHSRYAANEF